MTLEHSGAHVQPPYLHRRHLGYCTVLVVVAAVVKSADLADRPDR